MIVTGTIDAKQHDRTMAVPDHRLLKTELVANSR